jgi:hypothetical protein
MKLKTQEQMFYESQKKSSEKHKLFLELVKDGMTKKELEANIAKNPAVWECYSRWLEVLK